jgi:hypothetical protein
VFLYDPCADNTDRQIFRELAKNCLSRHIITPYKNFPDQEKFNLVSFGCRLGMNRVIGNQKAIIAYIRVYFFLSVNFFHTIFMHIS